jgi:type III restriction enzyme
VEGIPTGKTIDLRRESRLITPIPKPKKRGGKGEQGHQRSLEIEAQNISTEDQQYEVSHQINSIRSLVEEWRQAPESQWRVTPETARLLRHWRQHEFQGIRPFFCQIEAAETAIWLTEVAPELGKRGKDVLEKLERANAEANPELFRLALKLATGAGKTTVMAMLIAWQTINPAIRAAAASPRASWWWRQGSRSGSGCKCCSRTTPRAISNAWNWCRQTWCRSWARPGL